MSEINEAVAWRASTLEQFGLTRIEAKILSFLVEGKATGRDIERKMDLRQPEVSVGIKALQARGWVRGAELVAKEGKGRKEKTYELALLFGKIVNEIANRVLHKQIEERKKLEELIKTT